MNRKTHLKLLKIAILTLILMFPVLSSAQESSKSSCEGKNKIELPSGECVTKEQIQNLFDRSAVVIRKQRAEIDALKEILTVKEQQLANADAQNKNLEEQVALLKEVIALKTKTIEELQSAVALNQESLKKRDELIEKMEARIKKLEKSQVTIAKRAKWIGIGILIGKFLW